MIFRQMFADRAILRVLGFFRWICECYNPPRQDIDEPENENLLGVGQWALRVRWLSRYPRNSARCSIIARG